MFLKKRIPRILIRIDLKSTAFVCSVAMGLPVSGFPDMNAISQENDLGKPYLTTKDFVRNDIPSSIFCLICIATVGYGLMTLLGL